MATDWSTVENNMITAVKGVIGGAWPSIANGSVAGVKALVTIAQEIENSPNMSSEEKKQLMSEYQQSLQNTITAYASITAAIARNAVSAALTVLINAVPALAGFV